ncbi:MAG: hydrogenase nickel incorporation protein HypB [Candidatus Kapabacteria bacterium]|nr:hydrogenase nickel incorporation protein HypB [Candidatus Kapabacteria bacterium]
MSLITIEKKVLEANNSIADENRSKFKEKGIFSINLISSPGSGKTSLVEQTIIHLKDKMKIAVITGDIQTNLDAERIDKFGVPVVQIITNGGCHLDASLVRNAYKEIENEDIELLIIENVGNLVCPSEYDLGENHKICVMSVTEGDDKPLKYPLIFHHSEAFVINKIDLIPYLKCSLDEMRNNAVKVNPKLKVFSTSCYSCEGMDEWTKWLFHQCRM